MKKFVYFILLILVAYSCKKENYKDNTYGCKIVYERDIKLNSLKATKGWSLFSWENNENSWNYSIVQNLNITQTFDLVGPGTSYTGEECLKKNLKEFEGETIFWNGTSTIEAYKGKKIKLSYPPEHIIDDIKKFCESKNIRLRTEYDI